MPLEELSIHSNADPVPFRWLRQKSPPSQLRLPHGTEVEKFDVALQQIDHFEQCAERMEKV